MKEEFENTQSPQLERINDDLEPIPLPLITPSAKGMDIEMMLSDRKFTFNTDRNDSILQTPDLPDSKRRLDDIGHLRDDNVDRQQMPVGYDSRTKQVCTSDVLYLF